MIKEDLLVQPKHINLERKTEGLGFNIRGGIDASLMEEDSGIFVSKIRDGGTASEDGQLKVGDKIIQVNGIPLVGMTHQQAVETVQNAGNSVTLQVLPSYQQILMGLREHQVKSNPISNVFSSSNILLISAGLGLTAVFGFTLYRLFKSRSS